MSWREDELNKLKLAKNILELPFGNGNIYFEVTRLSEDIDFQKRLIAETIFKLLLLYPNLLTEFLFNRLFEDSVIKFKLEREKIK